MCARCYSRTQTPFGKNHILFIMIMWCLFEVVHLLSKSSTRPNDVKHITVWEIFQFSMVLFGQWNWTAPRRHHTTPARRTMKFSRNYWNGTKLPANWWNVQRCILILLLLFIFILFVTRATERRSMHVGVCVCISVAHVELECLAISSQWLLYVFSFFWPSSLNNRNSSKAIRILCAKTFFIIAFYFLFFSSPLSVSACSANVGNLHISCSFIRLMFGFASAEITSKREVEKMRSPIVSSICLVTQIIPLGQAD